MMKKYSLIRSALLVFIGLAVVSAATAQQNMKIGVVDSQKAFAASVEGKKAASQLQAKRAYFDKELNRMAEEIRQMESKLNSQRMTLTQDALTRLQVDIERKKTDVQRFQEDAGREFTALREKLIRSFQMEMTAVVNAMAKEMGYDLVLDIGASGIIYFNPVLDVTDDAIRRYDATKTAPSAPKK